MRARSAAVLSTITALLGGALVYAAPASAFVVQTPAADLLGQLSVQAENTSAYDRSYFQHWIDADGDGCDTRAEVLMAESQVPTTGGCPVDGGQWVSYYDGATWTLASDVDIDHMIPLSEAWDSGAQTWTAEKRRDFANDLGFGPSLVAVTDNVNASKGDKDPAEWLPPSGAATCRYTGEWIQVKYRWGLSVDTAERDALAGLLSGTCAGLKVDLPLPGGAPQAPDDPAIRAYVTKVYQDLFGRAPDAGGLQAWTQALQSGVPYGDVANAITYSTEYRSRLIQATYQRYLGRAAEPAGLASWIDAMARGMHIEQMQAGFIASDEFWNRGGATQRGWVTLLYQSVLERDPGSSEVDYWVSRLQQGADRYTVALGFVYSTEYLTGVVDGYYTHLLDRHIDPSGSVYWVTAIQHGARDEQIIAGIVSSPEYRSKP